MIPGYMGPKISSKSLIISHSLLGVLPLEKAVKKSPAIGASGKSSSLTTSNPVETPNISRPVTPTLFSFSQNANVINVTFNYGGVQTEED
ncbi:unnamed protein product [Rhizophagus irregularis]|nr:unnamed protein product [Rhizophagus irregularis]